MMNDASPLRFPCDFPVKVFGQATDGFEAHVLDIFQHHVKNLDRTQYQSRESGGGRFVAITVTIEAQSREQLDALYRALNKDDAVLMTL